MDNSVTTYAVDQPSYGYSTATTQFDDELIRRGIVTKQQALMGKGMSSETAQRLLEDEAAQNRAKEEMIVPVVVENASEDEDDKFLRNYRKQRIRELQQNREPRHIDRTQWKRYVNDASETEWVIVCLTSSDVERTGAVETAVHELAANQQLNVVLIPANSAIPNWPHENLPSLFLYRHGKMQHEILRMREDITSEILLDMLTGLGVTSESSDHGRKEEEDLDALD